MIRTGIRRRFTEKEDGHRLFFTSDTHFFHKAMLSFGRPFSSVEEMNHTIVNSWNSVVPKNGHVFLLGDVSFAGPDLTYNLMSQLNGNICLVLGNHDKQISEVMRTAVYTEGITDYHEISVDSNRIIMCHFPFRSWNGMHHGSWNLHGHSHGNLVPQGKQLDVGVDTHDFTPYSYWEVKEYMRSRSIEQVDHHKEK